MKKVLFFVIILNLNLYSNSNAWEEASAKTASMGGSYIAIGEGVDSIYYNPAGIATIERRKFKAGILYRLENKDTYKPAHFSGFGGIGLNLKYLHFGFFSMQSYYDGFEHEDPALLATYSSRDPISEDFSMQVDRFMFAVAKKFSDYIKFGLSVNLNSVCNGWFLETEEQSNEISYHSSKLVITPTAGIQARYKMILGGLSYELGKKFQYNHEDQNYEGPPWDVMPTRINLGAGISISNITTEAGLEILQYEKYGGASFVIQNYYTRQFFTADKTFYKLGAQLSMIGGLLKLRIGTKILDDRYLTQNNINFGVGVNLKKIELDTCYEYKDWDVSSYNTLKFNFVVKL